MNCEISYFVALFSPVTLRVPNYPMWYAQAKEQLPGIAAAAVSSVGRQLAQRKGRDFRVSWEHVWKPKPIGQGSNYNLFLYPL